MNNSTNNDIPTAEVINELYLSYVEALVDISGFALFFWSYILAIDQETQHIWLNRFSLPNLLYIFTRYGSLVYTGLTVWSLFIPVGSLCNIIINISAVGFLASYLGIQGLLITRAYSLCQGNKFVAGALVIPFLTGFILTLSVNVLFPGCLTISFPKIYKDITLSGTICVIVTDVLVFAVSLWKVWGTWKLKREVGIRGSTNLVSILMKQIVTKFCFVCFITFACSVIIDRFVSSGMIVILGTVQHALSVILTADGLLDLRRRNSAAIDNRNASLPSIHFQNALQHIHQSIMTEMGDLEDENSSDVDLDERILHVDATCRHAYSESNSAGTGDVDHCC